MRSLMTEKFSASSFFDTSQSLTSLKLNQDFTCACDSFGEKKTEFEEFDEDSEELDEDEEIKNSLWENILQESKELAAPYEEWLKEHQAIETENIDSPADYLSREIFPILLPAMEKTLHQARDLNVLSVQKCRFNGLDSLAEYLWNKNPRWPMRGQDNWLDVFDIPQFKLFMRLHPRPIFPKSWIWTTSEAASHIQRYVRGWLVRKREDVQEMRQFWKAITAEKADSNVLEGSSSSRVLDICERYKLLAKKRERPF